MAQGFRGFQSASDSEMRYGDRSPTDSDHSEDDSDHSAPPRRSRGATHKGHRARANKVRTLNRWTTDEHDKLAFLVGKWGSEKNWAKVAEEMPGRTGKQCRERWLNHMKPGIVKGNWSPEEEFLLAQCHALVGSHWSKMTKRLPGRTENSIKNFWNATLRSKAPNKKRGMLWTYMQLHDAKSDDNTAAIVQAVDRLFDTQELPEQLIKWIKNHQLGDMRTWKIIHKAEKEFLENVSDQLHPLSLPNNQNGNGLPQGLHGYGGAADAVVAAAGASPAGSPLASSSQIHEYSYSQGHGHGVHPGSFVGQGVGGMTSSQSYLQPPGMSSHYSNADVYSTLPAAAAAGLGGDGSGGLLSSAVPGAMGLGGQQGSGGSGAAAAAAAAAGGYVLQGPNHLLTAQHPMLSCAAPEGLDQEFYQMLEAAPNSGSDGASGLGTCGTLAANNGAVFAAAADSAAAGVVVPAKDSAQVITIAVNGQTFDGSASAYASQTQMGPNSTGSTMDGQGTAVNGDVAAAAAAYSSHLQQHLTPVNSCEGTGTPVNGSPLLNTIGCHEQQQQQQFVAGLPASAAYCSSGSSSAAAAEFARRVVGPVYSDIKSDISFGMAGNGSRAAAGGRPAGGHGEHCSCGPCSNSQKLHKQHGHGARRNQRPVNAAAVNQRYQGMTAHAHHSDVGVGSCGYQPSNLKRESHMTQLDLLGATGYHSGHTDVYNMLSQQQQQQPQQHYADASTLQQQVMMMQEYSAVQPAGYQQFAGNAGAAAEAAMQQVKQEQPGCLSPFAQHAAAGGAADAVIGSMPWFDNQQQMCNNTDQHDLQEMGQQHLAAGQMLAPPPQQPKQQQEPDQKKEFSYNHLKLDLNDPADALRGFLQSPLGQLATPGLPNMLLLSPAEFLLSARQQRISWGQIAGLELPGVDWTEYINSRTEVSVNPAGPFAAAAAGCNSGRPSDNGANPASLLACGGALGSSVQPTAGVKRARCSYTSVDDDGSLLIHQPQAKVARSGEASAAAALYEADSLFPGLPGCLN